MTETPEKPKDINERTADLVDEYTAELNAWVNERVPLMLTNGEFAARTAALMIALNRQLARTAVAFGETHGVDSVEVGTLVVQQFAKNHAVTLQNVQTAETVQ